MSAAPAASPPLDEASARHPRRHLVFGIVSIALFMASIDQTIVATALGTLQRDLHAPVNWSSWTITIYALGQIIVMPLAGSLSDQYGRRRVFVVAIVVFTTASLCCGLVGSIYLLVPLRAVQAIGGGAFMPSATGIVSDMFGPDRDRAVGLFTSIFPIGGIVGPVLGGVFVTYWSWRGIFLVNVPPWDRAAGARYRVRPRLGESGAPAAGCHRDRAVGRRVARRDGGDQFSR